MADTNSSWVNIRNIDQKKPYMKEYIQLDPIYVTFSNRQNKSVVTVVGGCL